MDILASPQPSLACTEAHPTGEAIDAPAVRTTSPSSTPAAATTAEPLQGSLAQGLQDAGLSGDSIQGLLAKHEESKRQYTKCVQAESIARVQMKASFSEWWLLCTKLQELYLEALRLGNRHLTARAWALVKTAFAEECQIRDRDEIQKYRQFHVDLSTWLPDEQHREAVLDACPSKNKMRALIAHFRSLQKAGELDTSNASSLKSAMVAWFANKRMRQEAALEDTRLAIERAPAEAVLQTQALERTMNAFMAHVVLKDTDLASMQHVVAAIQFVCGDDVVAAAAVDSVVTTSSEPRGLATRASQFRQRRPSQAQAVQAIRAALTDKYAPATSGGSSVQADDGGANATSGEEGGKSAGGGAAEADDEEAEATFEDEEEEDLPMKRSRPSRRRLVRD